MNNTTTHPSNVLQRGECASFEQAMRLVAAQVDRELSMFTNETMSSGNPETDHERKLNKELREWRHKAFVALNEYVMHKAKLDREFAVWLRSQNDEQMTEFAEALASGDYSKLAI